MVGPIVNVQINHLILCSFTTYSQDEKVCKNDLVHISTFTHGVTPQGRTLHITLCVMRGLLHATRTSSITIAALAVLWLSATCFLVVGIHTLCSQTTHKNMQLHPDLGFGDPAFWMYHKSIGRSAVSWNENLSYIAELSHEDCLQAIEQLSSYEVRYLSCVKTIRIGLKLIFI